LGALTVRWMGSDTGDVDVSEWSRALGAEFDVEDESDRGDESD
jgi:hypothetical protein